MRFTIGDKIKVERNPNPLLLVCIKTWTDYMFVDTVTGTPQTEVIKSHSGHILFDGNQYLGSIISFCQKGTETWIEVSSIIKERIVPGAVFENLETKKRIILIKNWDNSWLTGGLNGDICWLYSNEWLSSEELLAYLSRGWRYIKMVNSKSFLS
jgi:hypothetical protein